jgi:hypothetical protein
VSSSAPNATTAKRDFIVSILRPAQALPSCYSAARAEG